VDVVKCDFADVLDRGLKVRTVSVRGVNAADVGGTQRVTDTTAAATRIASDASRCAECMPDPLGLPSPCRPADKPVLERFRPLVP
jgi:hypothetical protein